MEILREKTRMPRVGHLGEGLLLLPEVDEEPERRSISWNAFDLTISHVTRISVIIRRLNCNSCV